MHIKKEKRIFEILEPISIYDHSLIRGYIVRDSVHSSSSTINKLY